MGPIHTPIVMEEKKGCKNIVKEAARAESAGLTRADHRDIPLVKGLIMGNTSRARPNVTIHDVAAKAGVSIAAVSYAMNGKGAMADETRLRIQRMAQSLGYVPNALARGLHLRRTDVVGLVVPDIDNVYMSTIVRVLEKDARGRGFFLLLGCTGGDTESEQRLVRDFIAKSVDAFILFPAASGSTARYRPLVQLMDHHRIPCVLVTHSLPATGASAVELDIEEGQRLATAFALDRGARHLVFAGGPRGRHFPEVRYRGFLRAHREAGVRPWRDAHLCVGESYTFEEGFAAARPYAEGHKKLPDCFLAMNDAVAFGIHAVLSRHGIRVPEDVSLVGFDDVPLPTLHGLELTTMRIPVEEMSAACVRILDTYRDGARTTVSNRFVPQLIRRGTVKNFKGGLS